MLPPKILGDPVGSPPGDVATADGKANADLLRFDGIHLNDKGYAVSTSLIKPTLLAAYAPAARTAH